MADVNAAAAAVATGAKRKQRSSVDALCVDADRVPLLTPSKRFSTGSVGVKSPNGEAESPSSPLVIARSPSDTSRLWAARIAATQRIARRRGSGPSAAGASGGGSRASSAMAAKRRASLSLSPAAASFEASVSITSKLLPKKPKIKVEPPPLPVVAATPVKTTPVKSARRRASAPGATSRQVIDLVEDGEVDGDVDMGEDKHDVKKEDPAEQQDLSQENDEPAQDDGVDLDESLETEDTEEQNAPADDLEEEAAAGSTPPTEPVEEEANTPPAAKKEEETAPLAEVNEVSRTRVKIEPGACIVPIKTEPAVSIKEEATRARTGERPPLVPTTSRRRTLFEAAEAEREAVAEASSSRQEPEQQDEQPQDADGQPSDAESDVGELNERLAVLAATLAAEQAEKAALKQKLDEMAARLRESEERQQQLERQLASLSIEGVSIKQERA